MALLKSRKVIVSLCALLLNLLVTAVPDLAPYRAELMTVITGLALGLIGGIAYEDAARAGHDAGSQPPLYGSTAVGGSAGHGTLFKINTNGSGYLVIHAFTGNPDGAETYSKIRESTNGVLYGVTGFGGINGGGTVYRLNKDGSEYNVVHYFSPLTDGYRPVVGLLEGSDGALYGTTEYGGTNSVGTLFKVNKDGNGFTVLRHFLNIATDAQNPSCELTEGSDGAVYGACTGGGTALNGCVFKLNKDGSGFTFLRRFSFVTGDAEYPIGSGLTECDDGVFYGATFKGGDLRTGCVYALSLDALPPRVSGLSVSNKSNVVQFAGSSGISYDVQRSSDLTSWSILSTVTFPLNGIVTFTDTNRPPSAGFYRLKRH